MMRDEDYFNSDTFQAELYRQNYEDALDEIRNLRFRIKELEQEVIDLGGKEPTQEEKDLAYKWVRFVNRMY